MRNLLALTTLCLMPLCAVFGQTACLSTQSEVVIEILTDRYGYETGWKLTGSDGTVYDAVPFYTYGNRKLYRDTLCIPTNQCAAFTMLDDFGDGMGRPGYYLVLLNGDTLAYGGTFDAAETTHLQCTSGEICTIAEPVYLGKHTTPLEDTWYEFIPDSTGIYRITTCALNTCDTKIWIYDKCTGITIAEDNQSTIFFNDNENPCAPLAEVRGYFYADKTYLIRIGDNRNACPSSIVWELIFEGPLRGCTNPQSCNYNPLATVNNGSCLPQGHRNCPKGPDLVINQDTLMRSLRLDTLHANDACLIQEGCLRGYGVRDILRFSTQIENKGERDYFIGKPNATNSQFSFNNCHNHFHYDSYAEYLLFKRDGTKMPAGFKNGFCVTDFGCGPGQTPKFSCDNMGISADCYDTYWAEIECQWIDLTDVQDGEYTLVVRVNWKNYPDAIGQVEKDIANNWAQVCLLIDRSSGTLKVYKIQQCDAYLDCSGVPYGNAQTDCAGICKGSSITGDVNGNGMQDLQDAEKYVTLLLGNDLEPSPCTDLDADGKITVYDAVLFANCINYGNAHPHTDGSTHNHCEFPNGIFNPTDTITLDLLSVNWEEHYADVWITNPTASVHAYQFDISGGTISYVENLADENSYPILPRAGMSSGMVVGISYRDSALQKSTEPQSLCRVHFFQLESDSVVIEQVTDFINGKHERVLAQIGKSHSFRRTNGISSLPLIKNIHLSPNPFKTETTLSFYNPTHQLFQLDIIDLNGKLIQQYFNVTDSTIRIERQNLPSSIYFYRLVGEQGYATGKLIAQ